MDELPDTVEAALAHAYEVFAHYPPPIGFGCRCAMCVKGAEKTDRAAAKPYDEITEEDLFEPWVGAYRVWGQWPDLAYFLPRTLRLYAEGASLMGHLDFDSLLVAARPELDSWDRDIFDESTEMPDEERHAVFQAMLAIFETDAREDWYHDPGVLTFLAAFDAPVAPLLDRWLASTDPVEQERLLHLYTAYDAYAAHGDPSRIGLPERPPAPLPENQAAMDVFLSPLTRNRYRTEHAHTTSGPDTDDTRNSEARQEGT